VDTIVILSKLEQEYLLRIIESAVQVRDLRQFFLWTQGQLQALLPHRLMVCMHFDAGDALLRVECLHGSVLDDASMKRLCDPDQGLAPRLARHWREGARLPAVSELGDGAAQSPLARFQPEIEQGGFDNLVLHGTGRLLGGGSVFALFGLPLRPGSRQAYFLELLLPHLHMALLRLSEQGAAGARRHAAGAMARPLSGRETEILGWLREGKSNYEVGCILGISALTVKNHLQRIYKTLGVSNRTHALSRCMALRLLDPAPARER
jgi:transcriptional regulator EpsA